MRTDCALGNPARIGDKSGNSGRCRAQFDGLVRTPDLGSARSNVYSAVGFIAANIREGYYRALGRIARGSPGTHLDLPPSFVPPMRAGFPNAQSVRIAQYQTEPLLRRAVTGI